MAHFALLWKARTIEKYRIKYENEKMKSILLAKADLPTESFFKRWCHCHYNCKKRLTKVLRRWFPEASPISNFLLYLRTDQTFPNFVLKSILGFVGGIVMTYLFFMFFVFQLAISLIHATIMSSIIGVMLTLGLAFSYRARCLVFLLIPQFFSRVGRYTLTCYALVLILTGPATNTLKNSEVLSESMACSQEQLKTSVREITESAQKPFNSMKDIIKAMIDKVRIVTADLKETLLKIHRLALSIVSVLQSSLDWLNYVVHDCNKKLGTPYERCNKAIEEGTKLCRSKLGPKFSRICNVTVIGAAVCETFKPLKYICVVIEFVKGTLVFTVQKKLQAFANHIKTMLYVAIHVHHSYSFSSNSSRSASQVAAGIVTEIRSRADPLLTWLSWSSCVTSLFLLLIIFRAKYYQNMYETRSRFDNRYVTKDLRDLDLKRMRQGRETVLPLNRREKAKYVTTTSFRLVAFEKLYMTRSAVFMLITTLKLLIHIVADYSLYWVLMTIRYHGRFQTPMEVGSPNAGVLVTGHGPVAGIIRAIIGALSIPIASPEPSVSCLPNPYPPDLQRYAQIGVLIFLHWFFALFEPFGLRLRHVIMGLYRPERAKARAVWLYNHILRMRGSFLKFARRKLHRQYKYYGEEKHTFRHWVNTNVPCSLLRYLLGVRRKDPNCMLCGTTEFLNDTDTRLTRCETPGCPGIYCACCFIDIGQLCTICLSPSDYGDLSDVSLEKGSSDESDSSDHDESEQPRNYKQAASLDADDSDSSLVRKKKKKTKKPKSFTKRKYKSNQLEDQNPLLEDEEENSTTEHTYKKDQVCYRMEREKYLRNEMHKMDFAREKGNFTQNENFRNGREQEYYINRSFDHGTNDSTRSTSTQRIQDYKSNGNVHSNDFHKQRDQNSENYANNSTDGNLDSVSVENKYSESDKVHDLEDKRYNYGESNNASYSKRQIKQRHDYKSGSVGNKKHNRIRCYNLSAKKIFPTPSETFFGKFAKYLSMGGNSTEVSLWPLKCSNFGHLRYYKIQRTSNRIHVTKIQRPSKFLRRLRKSVIRLKNNKKRKQYKRVPKNKVKLNGIPKHVELIDKGQIRANIDKNGINAKRDNHEYDSEKNKNCETLWSKYRYLKYFVAPIQNLIYLDDTTATEESKTKPSTALPGNDIYRSGYLKKKDYERKVRDKLKINNQFEETKILIKDVIRANDCTGLESKEKLEMTGSKSSLASIRRYFSTIFDDHKKVKFRPQLVEEIPQYKSRNTITPAQCDAETEVEINKGGCAIQHLEHSDAETQIKLKTCNCTSRFKRNCANAGAEAKAKTCTCAVQYRPADEATETKTCTCGSQNKKSSASGKKTDVAVEAKNKMCSCGIQPKKVFANCRSIEAKNETINCATQYSSCKQNEAQGEGKHVSYYDKHVGCKGDSIEYVNETIYNITDYTESSTEKQSTESTVKTANSEITPSTSSNTFIPIQRKDWWSPLPERKFATGIKMKTFLKPKDQTKNDDPMTKGRMISLLHDKPARVKSSNLQNYFKNSEVWSVDESESRIGGNLTESDFSVFKTEMIKDEPCSDDEINSAVTGLVSRKDNREADKKKDKAKPNKQQVTFKSTDEIISFENGRLKKAKGALEKRKNKPHQH